MRYYFPAVLLVAAAFTVRLALDPLLDERSPFLLFTFAVLVAGARYGAGAGLLATALSTVAGIWAFMEPRFALGPLSRDEWTNIAAFVVTSGAILLVTHQLERSRSSAARSAAARRYSEEREQRLIDAVQDYAIFELDAEGRMMTWNPGAERIKGWRADEIIGKPFAMLHTPEQQEAGETAKELGIAIEEGRYREEGPRTRKDGSRFAAEVNLFPIRENDGSVTGFVKVTRDITDRKRAEARGTAAK